MRGKDRLHLVRVGDIRAVEFIAVAVNLLDACEVRRIASVRQRIDIRQRRDAIVVEDVADEIAADKTAAAGDKDSHKARASSSGSCAVLLVSGDFGAGELRYG